MDGFGDLEKEDDLLVFSNLSVKILKVFGDEKIRTSYAGV